MSQKQVVTRPGGTIKVTRDATANDSDKLFSVPTGKIWEVLSVFVELTTTATVGNRYVIVTVQSAGAVVYQFYRQEAHAASTSANYMFAPFLTTVTTGNYRYFPLGKVMLNAGEGIRVYDGAAVDAAADDMTVSITCLEYEA